jgi:hypothetical protein
MVAHKDESRPRYDSCLRPLGYGLISPSLSSFRT